MMQRCTKFIEVVCVTIMLMFATIFLAGIVYAQQLPLSSSPSPSPSAGSSSSPSTTTVSPELKAKMCDPNNPSLRVVNTTESHICGIPKTVKPPVLAAIPPSTSAATSSSSTSAETRATTAPVSNPSSRILSSSPSPPSTIAPQVNTINKLHQPQLQQQQIVKTSNSTAGQNYTFASTSPVVTSGKLMYLGYHGDTTHSSSTGKSSTTNLDTNHGATADSNSKHKVSSDTKQTTATSDSTHKHDNTKGKNSHESGDSLEGILKGVL